MNHVACCFGMGGLPSLLSSSLSSSFPSLSNGQKHALAMGSGYEVVTQAALHAAPYFSLSLRPTLPPCAARAAFIPHKITTCDNFD